MKTTWSHPVIEVQKFAPNEYYAVCGEEHKVYNFECNAGNRRHEYAVLDANGNAYYVKNYEGKGRGYYVDGSRFGIYFYPCSETHSASVTDDFVPGYHLDDLSTSWKDENIPVIVWDENGTNIHCTTNLDISQWTTDKS